VALKGQAVEVLDSWNPLFLSSVAVLLDDPFGADPKVGFAQYGPLEQASRP
jgi:hypothetical protein